MRNPITRLLRAIKFWHTRRRQPLRLEFVVTDNCNLNCRGCTHYSPLVDSHYDNLETLIESMRHLGKTCGRDIQEAYLIGGETLLYPRLEEAMEALRRHFPTQRLSIFTNGLLIPRMPQTFWDAARRLRFVLAITEYPIKFDYAAAEALCREQGVETEVFADRSLAHTFFRFALDPTKSQNGRMSHFKCFNRGCISIIGNKLYPCSISACSGHLNRRFGTEFTHSEGDFLHVPAIKSSHEIRLLRDRPVPFCSYCLPPDARPYAPSRRDPSEWIAGQPGE